VGRDVIANAVKQSPGRKWRSRRKLAMTTFVFFVSFVVQNKALGSGALHSRFAFENTAFTGGQDLIFSS
jgi:hypothetical protein